ncbi:hypothetical protein HQN90_11055 [Paenibacillus alba]|uniref:hypothetical protein n=1 Tax=Paenibacillus alba TaxID=1197127 RepID=UPI0015655A1A|nr:hypothetical protein [Paenibacillus alba]NQX66665.1 hypothetical protein [Paenibacillus alba]
MDNYFDYVMENVTREDLTLLKILNGSGELTKFRAITLISLREKSEMSEAIFRKVFTGLTYIRFIESDKGAREQRVIITSYGKEALKVLLEEM